MLRTAALAVLSLLCVFSGAVRLFASNPLLDPSDAPYGAPRFDRIHAADILPAVEASLRDCMERIERVRAVKPGEETFENVVAALLKADSAYRLPRGVLNYLRMGFGTDSIAHISALATKAAGPLSVALTLDSQLFVRVKALYDRRHELELDSLRRRTLAALYRRYVRGGVRCTSEGRKRLRAINLQINLKQQAFDRNYRRASEESVLYVQDAALLKGISLSLWERLTRNAEQLGRPGTWAIRLTGAEYGAVISTAQVRELREALYRQYAALCTSGPYDNRQLAADLINLRLEKARVLGYDNYRDYALAGNTARDSARVYGLLLPLMEAAAARSRREHAELEAFAVEYTRDSTFRMEPWDRRYFEVLYRRMKGPGFPAVSRYLAFENVLCDGVFYVAERLYGITFVRRTDIPVYHADVLTFEAKDADGTPLGVLYLDCFARRGKRPGAWSGSVRPYSCWTNKEELPLASVMCNFARPAAGKPQLLGVSEVRTLFHEFGHALAALLSRGPYSELVNRFPGDMVELPSQLSEHWAWEPEVMKRYARDHATGRPIAAAVIDRLREAMAARERQNPVLSQCAAALFDLEWHAVRRKVGAEDLETFEKEFAARYGVAGDAILVCRTARFNHIFGGGYAARYYSYLWSAALDTDAFEAFTETGDIFDRKTAERYRRYVLSGIGHDDPMKQYVRFRGKEPDARALMRRYGFEE